MVYLVGFGLPFFGLFCCSRRYLTLVGVLFVYEVPFGLLWAFRGCFGFSGLGDLAWGCLPILFARFSCPLHFGFHSVMPSLVFWFRVVSFFGSSFSGFLETYWSRFLILIVVRSSWYRVIYVGHFPSIRGFVYFVALPTPLLLRLVSVALLGRFGSNLDGQCAHLVVMWNTVGYLLNWFLQSFVGYTF